MIIIDPIYKVITGDENSASEMGLSIAELEELEEGAVLDMMIESGNDACSDEYCTVADQAVYDRF